MPTNSRAAAPPKPPRPHPSNLLNRPAIELHYTQRTKQSTDGPSSTIQDTPRPDKKKRPAALLERKALLSSELVDAKILAAMDAEARKAEMGKMKQAIGPPKRPQPTPPQPEPEPHKTPKKPKTPKRPESPRRPIEFNGAREERLRRKAREEAKQRDKLFSKRRSGPQKPASSRRRRRRGTRRNRRISRRKITRKKKRTN